MLPSSRPVYKANKADEDLAAIARAQDRQRVHIVHMGESPLQEARRKVMMTHRGWEYNARWAAHQVARRLRNTNHRELAQDETYLDAMTIAFMVEMNHVDLFKELVRELVKYDARKPVQSTRHRGSRKQWMSLEMQEKQARKK